MNGGLIEDADMNQEEMRTLPTASFTFQRRISKSTRIIGTVAVAVLICSALGCRDPARDNMEAMIKRAQKQFSPGELQAAVASLCATNDSYVPVQDLPHEILSLSDTKPSHSLILEDKAGKRTLLVSWGGEMFSWGVGICPPGGVLVTNMAHARILRWSDSVFFFYE
jgi:hypothetical protein